MFELGKWNDLPIVRFTDHGAYLDGGNAIEILMPKRYVLSEMKPGDVAHVFVYLDQSEMLVATTETPLAQVGEFAFLEVSWTNEFGAFLNWGLMKDLFVPFREQKKTMEEGRSYIVHVHIDEQTHRIVGSAKVERYFSEEPPRYHRDEEVEILVWQKTPLGFKVIVDNKYQGQLYDNQIFGNVELRTGHRLHAYVVQVRPDGKLDLSIQRLGKGRFRDFSEILLEELEEAGGSLPFTDKSDSEEIANRFGVSKKTFKRAVGTLYKERKIVLSDTAINLAPAKPAGKPANKNK